jgi:putative Mg2+ transporter-C (MgtC) family protein
MDLYDSNWLPQVELAIKVAIAGLFGGIIGFERELADRPAGLRTHALLSAAAAMLVGTSDLIVEHFVIQTTRDILRVDPIRVVEAVVTGTAFIGAGTIFRHRSQRTIEGLTTAASLVLAAAIGIAVAMRQLLLGAMICVLVLILLRSVSHFIDKTSIGQSNDADE